MQLVNNSLWQCFLCVRKVFQSLITTYLYLA